MGTYDPHQSDHGIAFDEEFERLHGLVADMERIRRGTPYMELAADAPLLDFWSLGTHAEICLVGRATGHPLLPGARRPISTSSLWMISKDRQFARTLSRWYRLGTPADMPGTSS